MLLALLTAVAGLPNNSRVTESTSAAGASLTTQASSCEPPAESTFEVFLPKLGFPPDDEGQGWTRPKVWGAQDSEAHDETITIPNGRPIYALIISGYESNAYLDELMVYDFARHLMAQGAYVHYSWWNNLLAPYMERPLHHQQSFPGSLSDNAFDFATAAAAGNKALPGEDYQLVADAKRFLTAVRQHNPSAMIIVVGHSMGGGATVHLGSQTNVVIDILAPIDPVGNRNYPWAGIIASAPPVRSDYNWTRWRVSRDNFLGYKSAVFGGLGEGCVPSGPWLKDATETQNDFLCSNVLFVDTPSRVRFHSNIINLHHRYQKEFLFPFDYPDEYDFGHTPPPGGTSSQSAVAMTPGFCGIVRCSDPGGWPLNVSEDAGCCPSGPGVGWNLDGHGEIVGYRGPSSLSQTPIPLAVRVRTSPQCGSLCPDEVWPARSRSSAGTWSNGDGLTRKMLLQALEDLPLQTNWQHRPTNSSLCLVSNGLIQRFNTMNKPPTANAGADQTVECTGHDGTPVTLDGRGSTDPDSDTLEYAWAWTTGNATGARPTISLPKGTHCITLTVRDPSAHIDRDVTTLTITDTTPPNLTVSLTPRVLWPPNHALWTINANVQAVDLCGEVASIKLMSIVSNQPDNGLGDGDTTNDIQDAALNTLDLVFRLRAERTGPLGERRYTVTYRATDDSGNSAYTSAVVIVPHDLRAYKEWLRMFGKFGSNVFPNQNWTIRKPNANPGARERQAGKAHRQ
jgi:pimeloyl-ACP methyl ester carboxylesterase